MPNSYLNNQEILNSIEKPLIIDSADPNNVYLGFSSAGVATSQNQWKIQKITTSGAITRTLHADGNAHYDNVWDNRASLSYS